MERGHRLAGVRGRSNTSQSYVATRSARNNSQFAYNLPSSNEVGTLGNVEQQLSK